MIRYFRCQHCHQLHHINIRLKVKQKYCSSKACQQDRKNLWERKKLSTDSDYFIRRKACKAAWRRRKPADRYQSVYRGMHPGYEKRNKLLQQERSKTATAVVRERLLSKIVKTDALIVEIRSYQGIQNEVVLKSGSL